MKPLHGYPVWVVILFVLSNVEAQFITEISGVRYYLDTDENTFEDAVQACRDHNRYIAVLDDVDLNKRVYRQLLADGHEGLTPWIGVKKDEDSCVYRTVAGSRVPRFQNFVATTNFDEAWCATLQVFPFNSDDFQSIFYHGEWYGRRCNESHPVICQDRDDPDCPGSSDDCKRTKHACDVHGVVGRDCIRECRVRDDCPGARDPPDRDLNKYCFFQPFPKVDTFENALATCGRFGGTILNILTTAEYRYFAQDKGFFEACNIWDQYFLGLYQKAGAGAPRWTTNGRVCTIGGQFTRYFGFSHFNLISYDLGLNFWSSKDKTGLVLVLQATTNKWALLSPAPVVLDSPTVHSKFERRKPRFALYWCEARKDDFCMSSAIDIPNADRYFADCSNNYDDCDDHPVIVFTCRSGYEFADGDSYKRVKCLCDLKAFRSLIPKAGCIPIDKCRSDNPCDHFCLGFSKGVFRCACKSGFILGSKGECIDIDECKVPHFDNKCPVAPYGGCRNTYGGFLCFCNVGYNMDGAGYCQVFGGGFSVDFIIISVYIRKTIPSDWYGSYDKTNEFHEWLRIGAKEAMGSWFQSTPESFELREVRRFERDVICLVLKINLFTKISVRDQSYVSFSIFKRVNDPHNVMTVHGEACPFFPGLKWQTDDGKLISITTPCSILDALGFCLHPSSKCEVVDHYGVCKCNKGFFPHGDRCDVQKEEEDGDPWSGLEIFLFVAVICLIVMVICICICLCSLCGRVGRGSVGEVYGSHPPHFPAMTKVFRTGLY